MKTGLDILYVDDHCDTAWLMREALESGGHNAVIALTSNQALDLIQQREFDLYVLDLRLPQIDGLELCRRIRALHSQKIVIIFSALDYEVYRQAAYDAGATMYVGKHYGIEPILSIANQMGKASVSP
ncbi:MAG TPA: response regulator [Blastocatellia bacterium]|nr:response regulator [Blastocatellia bacterium]